MFTTDDVLQLERAIASGTSVVRYGDRTIQYQSLDAMRLARREMLDEINDAAGTVPPRRRIFRVNQSGTGYR